jgi:hypothetical protein
VNILYERETQLDSLKLQLRKIETGICENEKAVQLQLELAQIKIEKYKAKA